MLQKGVGSLEVGSVPRWPSSPMAPRHVSTPSCCKQVTNVSSLLPEKCMDKVVSMWH